jgi:hypothetical protein
MGRRSVVGLGQRHVERNLPVGSELARFTGEFPELGRIVVHRSDDESPGPEQKMGTDGRTDPKAERDSYVS